jgi:transposase
MTIAVLGVDLGKNSCSVVGLDAAGRVILRPQLHRNGVVKLATGSPGCVVAMEACCGAHHLGRRLREAGHEVRLMAPEYVQPYVKGQKNDERNAEAITEAATRPTMRFVELKSEALAEIREGGRDALNAKPSDPSQRHGGHRDVAPCLGGGDEH